MLEIIMVIGVINGMDIFWEKINLENYWFYFTQATESISSPNNQHLKDPFDGVTCTGGRELIISIDQNASEWTSVNLF